MWKSIICIHVLYRFRAMSDYIVKINLIKNIHLHIHYLYLFISGLTLPPKQSAVLHPIKSTHPSVHPLNIDASNALSTLSTTVTSVESAITATRQSSFAAALRKLAKQAGETNGKTKVYFWKIKINILHAYHGIFN